MDLSGNRYYQNSGAVPLAGLLAMLAAGGLAAVVLSPVYVFLNYWLPIIQLRFLVTLGLGALLGGLIATTARWGCVRNRLVCWALGGLTGALVLYFSWIWFLWVITEYQLILVDPLKLGLVIQQLAEMGLWQMRGRPLSGWELYGAWSIEALIIVGGAVALSAAERKPFCEACQCWTEGANDSPLMVLTDCDRLRTDLEDERYDVLDELRRSEVNSDECLQATIMKCPRCRDSNYLTVSHLTAVQDKEGNVEIKGVPIVRHLWIPAEVVERLLTPLPTEAAPDVTPESSPEGDTDRHTAAR